MKILYLTDQTFLHGGVEKVLSRKANWLAEVHGDEVFIITTGQRKKKPVYPFSPKIRLADLGINYNGARSYFHPVNLRKIPLHYKKIKDLIGNIKPDAVISCNYAPDFYFLPFIHKKIPKIKEFHSSRYFLKAAGIKDNLLKTAEIFVEKKYGCLAVLNASEVPFYHGKTVVIPNPAEASAYVADPASKKILCAGRIAPVKNFGSVMDAFSVLAKDFPDWELHFYGQEYAETQRELQKKAVKLNLQAQIRFPGVADDLQKTMRDYSIYAMTSETECFPMVLLEALSCGLPVLSWDAPTGPRHIVTNGRDGFITPYKNLDIFTEKLRELMQDENLRACMAAEGMKNVQRFSTEHVMQKWTNLFKKLRNEK